MAEKMFGFMLSGRRRGHRTEGLSSNNEGCATFGCRLLLDATVHSSVAATAVFLDAGHIPGPSMSSFSGQPTG
jgi:hypothetical protein